MELDVSDSFLYSEAVSQCLVRLGNPARRGREVWVEIWPLVRTDIHQWCSVAVRHDFMRLMIDDFGPNSGGVPIVSHFCVANLPNPDCSAGGN